MIDGKQPLAGVRASCFALQRPGFTILYERAAADAVTIATDGDAVARSCRASFGETRILFRNTLGLWYELRDDGAGHAKVLELAADELSDLLESLGLEY
jgi:hypothetical protein